MVYTMTRMGKLPKTNEERFWAKVDRRGSDDCWEWQGYCHPLGYGHFCKRIEKNVNKKVLAHRFSYELHNGQISKGKLVCHKCDNPPCVNPKHLHEGTQSINIRDSVRRGRFNRNRSRGSECYGSKLTNSDVRSIRIDNRSNRKTASTYGVSETTIRHIKSGKTWSWLV